jgi:hypothetical protein
MFSESRITISRVILSFSHCDSFVVSSNKNDICTIWQLLALNVFLNPIKVHSPDVVKSQNLIFSNIFFSLTEGSGLITSFPILLGPITGCANEKEPLYIFVYAIEIIRKKLCVQTNAYVQSRPFACYDQSIEYLIKK